MTAFVFPGQGAQYSGMGSDLYQQFDEARAIMDEANDIIGFRLTDVMFSGTDDDLRQTRVTQPAIFLHSIVSVLLHTTARPDAVAGHSLGEFSALVAAGAMDWRDALRLVSKRAQAMQHACETMPGTMAAIIGLSDEQVIEVCDSIKDEVVVPANFNSPGQVVISGTMSGIDMACGKMKEAGAKRALKLSVGGAFHSPLMQPAADELRQAILDTPIVDPTCPIYQNVTAKAVTSSQDIRRNLLEQLTSPVKWTQSVRQMVSDGMTRFYEFGPGDVLKGLIKRIDATVEVG